MSNQSKSYDWAAAVAVCAICICVGALGGCKMTTEARIAKDNRELQALEASVRQAADFKEREEQRKHDVAMVMIERGYHARAYREGILTEDDLERLAFKDITRPRVDWNDRG